MAPYFILVIFVSVLFYLDYKYTPKSGWIRIIALLAVICFAGFRYKICYDYQNYVGYYTAPDGYVGDIEIGFILFIKFLKLCGFDEQALFFSCSAITYIFIYMGFCKLTKNFRVAFIIFLLIPGLFLNSLTILRQALAMSFLFYGYSFLKEKKYVKYAVLCVVSILVHTSSILIIMFYLSSLFNWTKHIFVISLIVLPITIILGYTVNLSDFLIGSFAGSDSRYQYYRESRFGGISIAKTILSNAVFLLYLFVYHNRMDKDENKNISLLLFSVSIVNAFASSVFVSRLAYYFTIFEPVVAAGVIYKIKNKERIVIISLIITYFLFLFYSALHNDATLDMTGRKPEKCVPYRSIFNKNG